MPRVLRGSELGTGRTEPNDNWPLCAWNEGWGQEASLIYPSIHCLRIYHDISIEISRSLLWPKNQKIHNNQPSVEATTVSRKKMFLPKLGQLWPTKRMVNLWMKPANFSFAFEDSAIFRQRMNRKRWKQQKSQQVLYQQVDRSIRDQFSVGDERAKSLLLLHWKMNRKKIKLQQEMLHHQVGNDCGLKYAMAVPFLIPKSIYRQVSNRI